MEYKVLKFQCCNLQMA